MPCSQTKSRKLSLQRRKLPLVRGPPGGTASRDLKGIKRLTASLSSLSSLPSSDCCPCQEPTGSLRQHRAQHLELQTLSLKPGIHPHEMSSNRHFSLPRFLASFTRLT
ncbi:hypothetical protein M9458_051873, partial [Cirrhinus mrigala]